MFEQIFSKKKKKSKFEEKDKNYLNYQHKTMKIVPSHACWFKRIFFSTPYHSAKVIHWFKRLLIVFFIVYSIQ